MIGIGSGNWCFYTQRSEPTLPGPVAQTSLRDDHAEALARLIPILGCGEEAASLAFDGLARASKTDAVASAALRQIAADERLHDGLMHAVAAALPEVSKEAAIKAARRLHVSLGSGGFAEHLAKIAALDAAVCVILSRLLRADLPLTQDPAIHGVLNRIRQDEARHVALSRALVLETDPSEQMRSVAAEARSTLASVLMIEADAFEMLQVDPAKLERDVSRLPKGLFSR